MSDDLRQDISTSLPNLGRLDFESELHQLVLHVVKGIKGVGIHKISELRLINSGSKRGCLFLRNRQSATVICLQCRFPKPIERIGSCLFQCLVIEDSIRQYLHKFCSILLYFVVVMHELHKVAELQADILLSDVGTYVGRYRQTYEF